jgi:hypothetical protein
MADGYHRFGDITAAIIRDQAVQKNIFFILNTENGGSLLLRSVCTHLPDKKIVL